MIVTENHNPDLKKQLHKVVKVSKGYVLYFLTSTTKLSESNFIIDCASQFRIEMLVGDIKSKGGC